MVSAGAGRTAGGGGAWGGGGESEVWGIPLPGCAVGTLVCSLVLPGVFSSWASELGNSTGP